MIQFKYTLDKSSKKFVCPKCNKKSFVKYIETETNDYLSDEFGRCDRQSSCQYFLTPEKEQATFQILNIPKPETSYHSLELVEKTTFLKDNLGEHTSFFVNDPNDYMLEFKNFSKALDVFKS